MLMDVEIKKLENEIMQACRVDKLRNDKTRYGQPYYYIRRLSLRIRDSATMAATAPYQKNKQGSAPHKE